MDIRIKQCLHLVEVSLNYHPNDINLLKVRNILTDIVNGYNVVESVNGTSCWRIIN